MPDHSSYFKHLEMVMKISCITGIELPENEKYAGTFVEELLQYFLNFGYVSYTDAEIILACRFNCGTPLKHLSGETIEQIPLFGRYISVDYVSKILGNYQMVRHQLDRKLQNFIDGY